MVERRLATRSRGDGYLLQGLLGLPVGLWLVAALGSNLIVGGIREALGGLTPLVLLLPMLAAWFALRRYYRARGGEPPAALAGRDSMLFFAGLLGLGWGFGLVLGPEAGIAAQGAWLGLCLMGAGWRFALHRILGAALTLAGLVLPFALAGGVSLNESWSLVWLLFGITIIIASVYEHRVFVRSAVA